MTPSKTFISKQSTKRQAKQIQASQQTGKKQCAMQGVPPAKRTCISTYAVGAPNGEGL
jgi:hypothetical protein